MLHHIIVIQAQTEDEKRAAKAGIELPEEYKKRDEMVQVTATVVACGPEVFSDKPNSIVPSPGDVVMYKKLAGFYFDGDDGVKYRMIQDLDIAGIKGRKENE